MVEMTCEGNKEGRIRAEALAKAFNEQMDATNSEFRMKNSAVSGSRLFFRIIAKGAVQDIGSLETPSVSDFRNQLAMFLKEQGLGEFEYIDDAQTQLVVRCE